MPDPRLLHAVYARRSIRSMCQYFDVNQSTMADWMRWARIKPRNRGEAPPLRGVPLP